MDLTTPPSSKSSEKTGEPKKHSRIRKLTTDEARPAPGTPRYEEPNNQAAPQDDQGKEPTQPAKKQNKNKNKPATAVKSKAQRKRGKQPDPEAAAGSSQEAAPNKAKKAATEAAPPAEKAQAKAKAAAKSKAAPKPQAAPKAPKDKTASAKPATNDNAENPSSDKSGNQAASNKKPADQPDVAGSRTGKGKHTRASG